MNKIHIKRILILLLLGSVLLCLLSILFVRSNYKVRLVNSVLQGDEKTFESIIKTYGTEIELHPWWSMGIYPIHLVCDRGRVEMLKILIDEDANLKVKDEWGETCLDRIIGQDDKDLSIEMLGQILENSPSLVNIQNDRTGFFPLHAACFYKDDIRIIKMLISHGASVDQLDWNGNTPLDLIMKSPVPSSGKDKELISLIKSNLIDEP